MRILLQTGKGGTGKSVISCATGLKMAEMGYETLVVSSDPAHTLADALEKRVADEPTFITKNLRALHVDPVKEVKKNYSVIQEYVASIFSARGVDETLAYEIALLPGMTNLFAFLKIEELHRGGSYDVILLDMVPSGEALRYLYFPKLFGHISKKFISLAGSFIGLAKLARPLVGIPAPSREVLKSEVELIERLEALADVLRNSKISSLRLICNPDAFSIENTKRTLMTCNLYGLNVDLTIINKILPDQVKDPYFENWRNLQSKYIEDAEIGFYPIPVKKLQLFHSELKGIPLLTECAKQLFKDEDPARVYHEGAPYRFIHDKKSFTMVVNLPFATKELCEVERIGDELLIRVESDVGELATVIPLPAMVYAMNISKARFLNGELHITFGKDGKR